MPSVGEGLAGGGLLRAKSIHAPTPEVRMNADSSDYSRSGGVYTLFVALRSAPALFHASAIGAFARSLSGANE